MRRRDGFRVVLFWTELKQGHCKERARSGFRVVLFWTELKQKYVKRLQ